ncbi:response regulator [Haladaptatus pallidirubidus]|uniref:response regulator n=1 Tax=Haladaptatus pallidirubidus TaxID=1008152 RepID=UPI0035EBB426
MIDFLTLGNLTENAPIRVLHVDDDPARIRLSTTLLGRYLPDAEIYTETDPMVARDRLDADLSVDCIVSDFDMGTMDGLDFLEAVRERFSNLPFILFTGKGSEEIASEAISAGVTDYLQKSGGADQYAVLANRIENVVGQYRAERAATMYQRRMKTVYERVTDAFFALDADWRFTFVNGRGEELLNKNEAELVGKSVWNEFPDAVNSQFEDEYREAMESQQPTTFEAYFDPSKRCSKFTPIRPKKACQFSSGTSPRKTECGKNIAGKRNCWNGCSRRVRLEFSCSTTRGRLHGPTIGPSNCSKSQRRKSRIEVTTPRSGN